MSTFIVNLNDTIAMNDSAVVELAKIVSTSNSCEVETNWQEVAIVGIICLAIVIIALIAKWALWSWKDAEIKAAEKERDKNESEADIAKRKQKADCLRKLLDFLEKRTSKKEEFRDDESRYYIEVLQSQIDGQQMPKVPAKKN